MSYDGPYVVSGNSVPATVPAMTVEEFGMIIAALDREIGTQQHLLKKRNPEHANFYESVLAIYTALRVRLKEAHDPQAWAEIRRKLERVPF